MMRGFGLTLLTVVLLGLSGCGADNESTAEQLQKAQGPPPPTDVKGVNVPPPAKDMAEYIQQQKAAGAANPSKSQYGKAMQKR
jgi:hypothetical protein